jgi:hypothetical protein
MAGQPLTAYEQVMQLIDQLSSAQQMGLAVWLMEKMKTRVLYVSERQALFKFMLVDLGAVSPAYSDRREDWYA